MIHQQEIPKNTYTTGMPNIPFLEDIQQNTPLLLTLPTMKMSTNMGSTMDASRATTTIVARTPVELKQKSLIDIMTVPPKNIQPK